MTVNTTNIAASHLTHIEFWVWRGAWVGGGGYG